MEPFDESKIKGRYYLVRKGPPITRDFIGLLEVQYRKMKMQGKSDDEIREAFEKLISLFEDDK